MDQELEEEYINHEINVAILMMLQDAGAAAMKLRFRIPNPKEYPWEVFLELNFSPKYNPRLEAFSISLEDFNANLELDDKCKPKNFIDIFKFMEFMRSNFEFVENQIPIIEKKFMHFRFRAKQMLDTSRIDQKQLQKSIQDTLVEAYNIVSQRGILQKLYEKVVDFVNLDLARKNEFNFKRLYGLRTIEQEFNPEYGILMKKARDLMLTRRKLERILDKWSNIRVPGQSS